MYLKKAIKNITTIVDKLAFHMDRRIGDLELKMDDNVNQADEIARVIFET